MPDPFDRFEKGTHPLQRRSCSNPACTKVEAKKQEFRGCGSCRRLVYCSPDCQKQHWPMHKNNCKKIKAMLKVQKRRKT
eukprot:jgi/Bigna1/41036/e_gw1.49.85.1